MQRVILVHYKSMQYVVSFSQGRVSTCTLFMWGGHVFPVCVKTFSCYSNAAMVKIERVFFGVMTTNVLPRFLWDTVYIAFYASDAMLAQSRYCHVSVCLFITSWCSVQMAELTKLVSGTMYSYYLSYTLLLGDFGVSRIRILPSRTLSQTLDLEKFCHSMSSIADVFSLVQKSSFYHTERPLCLQHDGCVADTCIVCE